jgi:hypothetical protein
MNAAANVFVQEQIKQAHAQMYEEIERQVALRTHAEAVERSSQREPPLSQNRNPNYNPPSEQMMELSQWELSQSSHQKEVLNNLIGLKNKMRSNGEVLANLIGNASDMDE